MFAALFSPALRLTAHPPCAPVPGIVAQVSERLRNAKREIAAANEPGLFDYVIVNDSLEKALAQLLSTIQ